MLMIWLGMRDSNPRMVGPEPTALPLGESPTVFSILLHFVPKSKGAIMVSIYSK